MEFSKKFKVLLSFYVAIIGILKQRKPENFWGALISTAALSFILLGPDTPLNVICGHNMGVQACMMMGFHSRLLAGSFWGIEHLAELKIAKISSFFQGSGAGSVRSRSPYYWSRLRNFCWLGQSVNCGRILMIFTVLESSWKSRWRMSRFQSSGNQFEQR